MDHLSKKKIQTSGSTQLQEATNGEFDDCTKEVLDELQAEEKK